MCTTNTEVDVDVSSTKYTFLDREAVKKKFFWKSDSALYNAIKNYNFPLPIKVGGRRSIWRLSEVNEWIDKQPKGLDVGGADHEL